MLSPICLFTYNRPDFTRQTIEALQKNFLAAKSNLIIFSDGSKNEASVSKVKLVREYLDSVTGFKTISIIKSDKNKGLANSIISGVSQIIETYGKVIVLEDDLITSPNFLNFVNQALEFYNDHERIFSISGYTMDLPSLENKINDYYLGYRASCWGWGTWKNRWETIDWEVKGYNKFKINPFQQVKFMRGGSDMPGMLKNQMKGRIDSWAIRWGYNQFQNDMLTVFPTKSKLLYIGFGEDATHTKKETKRTDTSLDIGEQEIFVFDQNPLTNKVLIKEFRKKFSIINRLKDKLNR